MIGSSGGRTGRAERDDRILEHAGGAVVWREKALFHNVVPAVDPNAADVAAADGLDLVEERELRLPAVHEVAVIGGELPAEHVFFVGPAAVFAARHVDPRRHVPVDVEMGVESPGRFALAVDILQIRRLGDRREGLHQAAVDGHEELVEIHSGHTLPRLEFARQLADNLLQPLGIEHVGRFGERPQRGPATACGSTGGPGRPPPEPAHAWSATRSTCP